MNGWMVYNCSKDIYYVVFWWSLLRTLFKMLVQNIPEVLSWVHIWWLCPAVLLMYLIVILMKQLNAWFLPSISDHSDSGRNQPHQDKNISSLVKGGHSEQARIDFLWPPLLKRRSAPCRGEVFRLFSSCAPHKVWCSREYSKRRTI